MAISKKLYFTRSLPEGVIQQEEVDIITHMILDEAEKLGIKWEIIPNTNIIELTYKNKAQRFYNRAPNTSSFEAIEFCRNKELCKIMLQREGLEVAPGFVIYEHDADDRIRSIWEALKKPLVLKPAKGGHGKGVEVGLVDFTDCLKKIREYFENPLYQGGLMLEEMFFGQEYRILATKDKVLGIMERVPAHVIGDGKCTIEKLIQIENDKAIRNELIYPHIFLDDTSRELLKEQKLTLNSIPQKDQHIRLKLVSNISAGGLAIDRTDEVHDSVKEIALKAVQAIHGLAWTGIDFMAKDIYGPQTEGSYIIVEMNSAPEFDMHDMPMQGKPRGVTREFLYLMFPELRK